MELLQLIDKEILLCLSTQQECIEVMQKVQDKNKQLFISNDKIIKLIQNILIINNLA